MFKKCLLALIVGFGLPWLASAERLGGLDTTSGKMGVPKKNILDYASLIGTAMTFLGVLFLGLALYAGFLWMTAAGNDAKVTKAKGILLMAVIGIIIVTSAFAITAFLGDSLGK